MAAKKSKGPRGRPVRILIANGVNMDLLGTREPGVYGTRTLDQVNHEIEAVWRRLATGTDFPDVDLHFFQSNHEGIFLEALDAGWDGIIVNPGAWTHTSLALADRIRALDVPCVEVHLSNIFAREPFRHSSMCAPAVLGVISGFGADSYVAALFTLVSALGRST
jgi:3-dehydroquinate dehydratase-2